MIEKKGIILDAVQPRDYQNEILFALEEQGYRKLLIILARRGGKDYICWWAAIRQAIQKVCLVVYALPTFGQARRSIFEAIDSHGRTFISLIPKELIYKINVSEQKIVLTNGSIISCLGGDSHATSIRGSNPYLVVLSEYAYMDPEVYDTVRPILAANNGKILIVSTPFGSNHFRDLYEAAKQLPDWYVMHRNVYETQHISPEVIEEERAQMSPDLFAQEYLCDFSRGVTASFYGRQVEKLKQKGQITTVQWDPSLLVWVAIDIGVKDATTLIFYHVVGDGIQIRIIDAYSNNGLGLDHYASYMQAKPYRYGGYFAPHDLMVREWGGQAQTRYEKARQLGINFQVLDQMGVMDGIENVWTHIDRFWIDAQNCKSLIIALENYRREWDDTKKMYKPKPLHDVHSNYCDAIRYMCQSLPKTKKGLSSEDFDKQRALALYGSNQTLPAQLRPDDRNRRY